MIDRPLRQYALVKLREEACKREIKQGYYAELIGKQFIFLGEIPNQPGHCALIEVGAGSNYDSRFRLFYHTYLFEEVPEDET